jgi:hypothetical protein
VEQILLYIVTISGFSGFMLGLYSLLLPALQRRGIRLPFSARAEDDDELDDADDADARHFAATSFKARRGSLLDRLPSRAARPEPEVEEEDAEFEEDELLGDLDLSMERAEVEAEDEGGEYEGDELAELTLEAEVDPVLEALAVDIDDEDGEPEAEDEDEEEEDADEDEEEYEDDEEVAEPEKPVVHVVPAGGGNDMLALFEEGNDAVKEVETWRTDLPNPTMDELLTEAREISALIKGRRRPA